MGYTTDFTGEFKTSRPLTDEEVHYINNFADRRRMKRDVNKLLDLFKGEHGRLGVPVTATPQEIYGVDGEFFVGGGGFAGQDSDESILEYNAPPATQPGLWCQWELNDDGTELRWDGGEKFYNYIEWLEYLIVHFFKPWKIKLNGEIYWVGEDSSDRGYIKVVNNKITIYEGETKYKKRVS
mgnify:CR=1 FL=1